ncbi:MAG: phosphate regulon sensor histidine kinase PhoR [Sideroxydans sp.]|nr:phosphate regulon sensor histidine kinase PhoR [Sideroxydans sp.]MDD5470826.1 phosphate regulon sensor histidine kinase PhoR [Sideroxydans sp.]
MSDFWQRVFFFHFFLLLFSLLVWAIAGALPAVFVFAIGISLRLLHHLRNLADLLRWLKDPENLALPDGSGLWEEVFSHLNKMVRSNRLQREKHIASLQQMEQATAALPEGVVILDDVDRIEWCNPLASKHFGLDSDYDIGQQITYLARQPAFVQYLAAREFGKPLVLHGARQDDLILSIKLISYGENQRLLISRDITQLQRIETMRRDFVANVSHELRTPLTVVNGFVETLQDMPSRDSEMAQRALYLMGEQTDRMEHLVDDLLTLSRLEDDQNRLREEKVEVDTLLDEVMRDGKLLSNGKHRIELQENCGVNLNGSRDELRSAFSNLVSNAIRYTPDGGNIEVRWSLRDGHAVFAVKDSGIGIAQQHIARLAERFYRVDRSRSRETGGTGLGLAIVKHVAMRHQARLHIVSEEGQGSTFSIIFPAVRMLQ